MNTEDVRRFADWEWRQWLAPSKQRGPMHVAGLTPVGSVLMMRFTWDPDPQGREFLLPIDLSEHPPDDLEGASVTVLEAERQLTFETNWYEYKVANLTGHVALVLPEYVREIYT
jgi:hypothetical protein